MQYEIFSQKISRMMVILLIMIFIIQVPCFSDDAALQETPTVDVRGKVIRDLDTTDNAIEYSGGTIENSMQLLEVKITTGKFKGQIIEAEYALSLAYDDKQQNTLLKPGDEVLLTLMLDEQGEISSAYIYSAARDKYLLVLLVIFAAIILSVGKMKGLKALITLVLTVLAVMYILLPLILKGFDPVFISIWICIAITCVTLFLCSGFNKKTLAAVLGTSGGVIAAGIIANLIGTMAKLTGLGDEESQMLLYIPQNISFDFKGLLFAGIIIGALGASMDVGMSLASAMFEIRDINPNMTRGALIKSGMNIGRDMIATMSNTLILAYVGGSMQLMLLLMAYEMPFNYIINMDGIASEVVRSLAGSIGLILTIPLTALAVGILSETPERNSPHY